MTANTALLEKLSKIKTLADEAQDTHECQTALLMYQQLLNKHGLSSADVELTAAMQAETIEEVAVYTGRRIAKWMRYLYTTVAKHHRCVAAINKVLRGSTVYWQTLQFIGHKQDAEIAAEAFKTALDAAFRLYNRYLLQKAASSTCFALPGNGQSERNNRSRYMMGFAHGLEAAYRQQEAETTFDIIIMVPADVREHVSGYGKHTIRDDAPIADSNMVAGYNDGFNIGRGDRLAEQT